VVILPGYPPARPGAAGTCIVNTPVYTREVPGDHDEPPLAELLAEYLESRADPNPEMARIQIVWVEDDPGLGALHMQEKHRVEKHEVEEVLLEIPPFVEAKRSREHKGRTFFWGATRHDRWLFVVCEDWKEGGKRYLKPITAFEPTNGVEYWRNLK
jgi:hypothetical protein